MGHLGDRLRRAPGTITALAAEHRTWGLTPSHLAVLRIAASIADNAPLQLRALLPALNYEHTELVMIAIAHTAGYTRFTTTDTTFQPHPPLATWPEEPTPPHS